jgi:hypothetical protein
MWVGLYVVCFAAFGIGVEDKVNAAVLLLRVRPSAITKGRCWNRSVGGDVNERLDTFAANAMHLETSCPLVPSRVVIMPNLQAEMNSEKSSTFSLMGASSMFFAL